MTWVMRIWMKLMGVSCKENFKCKGWFLILKSRGSKISIGEKFRVNSSPLSSLIGVYQRTIIIARKQGTIRIGNNTGVTGVTIHGSDITIGDNVMVGANTKIIDHDFHSVDYMERRTDARDHEISRPIQIGDDCFIGCNSIILKGTHIGDRCIVGAGSVVHGVFENDCLIAGNPAKVIKKINQNEQETTEELI